MAIKTGFFGISKMQMREGFVDAYEGPLVIAGCAQCVWTDLCAIPWRFKCADVMAINDMIMHYPGKLAHAYSNDTNMLDAWVAARRPDYVRRFGQPIKHTCGSSREHAWPWPGHGSSALNAVYTALAMGYSRVLLCGVPLDNQPHYWQAPWERSNFEREVAQNNHGTLQFWGSAASKAFDGRVRSMSGRTRELLGGPDGRFVQA